MMRYILWFLAVIGLIIILIILLFGHGVKSTKSASITPQELLSYSSNSNSEVRATIDGPINANQDHQSVQITVNQNDVTYDQLTGYEGQVVNQQTFSSNQPAYAVFLHALNVAGYTEGNSSSSLSDERGYCATGERYIFEVINNGKDVSRFWSTSCGNPRSYNGSLDLTLTLFENQVPNFGTLTQNLQISNQD
jgi:hypothetical protein